MQQSQVTISIVCPCYNAGLQLQRLIDSVLQQSRRDWELIVVDGMSDDADTLATLRRNSADPRITIVRERDQGLYDAMNKGVSVARGTWVYFIGADDCLHGCDALAGLDTASPADALVTRAFVNGNVTSYRLFDWRMYLENTVLHQAVLYRRSVFDRFSYTPHYTVSADYDLNLHLYTSGADVRRSDAVVCHYSTHGISSQVHWQSYREEIEIRSRYIACLPLRWLLAAYSAVRFAGRRVARIASRKAALISKGTVG